VTAAQFNRAGTRVVTADADGSVRLWAPSDSGYKPVKLPAPINVPGGARYAAFSPDPAGSRLVVVTNGGSAEVWSDVTAKRLFPPLSPANGFTVTAAAFRPPAGQEVYTGDADGQVEIWSGLTGRSLGTIGTAGGASITDLEFNLTGTELVTAAADGMVTVRSQSHPKQRPLRISACPTPRSASFSPHGNQIVVACGDGSIPIFDARTGVHLVDLKSAYDGAINDAAFSPDGKSVVAAFGNRTAGGVEVWSTELATTSVADLRKVARSRLSGRLTNGERAALNAASGG
jgi:WD40 repeat protein